MSNSNDPEYPSIEVGMNVRHQENTTVYKITQIDDYVHLERIGDNKSVRLKHDRFFRTYEPLPEKEKSLLEKAKDKLEQFGLAASTKNLNLFRKDIPGIIVPPDDRVTEDSLVLSDKIKEEIRIAINMILNRAQFKKVWGLDKILDDVNRCIMNFYGPAGTGKTLAARYVANQLQKPLFQVKYEEITSKYNGETSKNIARVFAIAKEINAILFMDEADSIFSRRINMNEASDHSWVVSYNQNRNVLMQEIDRFDGIMFTTTNFFENFDPALLRRIARHVKFELPNKDQLVSLIKFHIPNMKKVEQFDFDLLAQYAVGLSGGDIKNVCLNAMERASQHEDPNQWFLTRKHLHDEIDSIKQSRRNNAGRITA